MVDSFAWSQPKLHRPELMVQPGPSREAAMLVVEAWQLTRHRPGRSTVMRSFALPAAISAAKQEGKRSAREVNRNMGLRAEWIGCERLVGKWPPGLLK